MDGLFLKSLEMSDSFGKTGPRPNSRPNDPPIMSGTATKVNDEESLVKLIISTWQTEYEIRKANEVEWDRCWRRIQNKYDWSRKQRWQNQKNFPAVLTFALNLLWEMTKGLNKAGEKWFETDSHEAEWQPLFNVVRDLILEMLENPEQPEAHVKRVFYDACFWALITGQQIVRVAPMLDGYMNTNSGEGAATLGDIAAASGLQSSIPSFGFGAPADPATGKPTLPADKDFFILWEAMNPRYFLFDTAGRRKRRYVIYTQTMTRGEFRKEAQVRGWRYVEETCSSSQSLDTEVNNRQKQPMEKNLVRVPGNRDQVVLHYIWGDLYDEHGDQRMDGEFAIVSQKKYLIQPPTENPYWHGRIPFAIGGALDLPGNPYAKSPVIVNLDGLEAKVDMTNQTLDYFMQVCNPPTEVDIGQLQHKPSQLANGLFPGKVLEVEKYAGNNGPAVARTGVPDMSPGVYQAYGNVRQDLAEYTGMAGAASQPQRRTRTSAKEATERMQAVMGTMEQIVTNIELDVLEPALRQTFLLILQFIPQPVWAAWIDKKIAEQKNSAHLTPPGPPAAPPMGQPSMTPPTPGQAPAPMVPPPPPTYENPELVKKLEWMKTLATPQQRFTELGAKFKFRVRIFTQALARREMLESLLQWAEITQGTPGAASRTKWHKWSEKVCECLEIDPDQMLWPNSGQTTEQPFPVNPDPRHVAPDLGAPFPPTDPPISGPM